MKKDVKKVIEKKKGMSGGKKVAIGAGLVALGAGAYYFLGPNGKKNQKKTMELMLKMKKEAMGKVAKLKSMSEPIYHKAVDTLSQNYSKEYKAHAPEIKAFAQKLKSEWKGLEKKAKSTSQKIKKSVKK